MESLYNVQLCPDQTVEELASLLRPGASVIDLGAGNGRHSLFLASLGYDVTAVDNNPDLVTECNLMCQTYGRRGIKHRAIELDIREDIFPDRQFDGVVCTHVLQHLTRGEVNDLFRTIERLTAPGGYSLVIAYMGHRPLARPGRTTLGEGELTLMFENIGWELLIKVDQFMLPTIEPGGRIFPNSRSVVLAKKPEVPAPSSELMTQADVNFLRRSDPDYYDDVIAFGQRFLA